MKIKILFANVLAIVLTSTMLVGSTFAWFADSNSSGVNQIKSGNLDVKLSYSNMYNENYVEVEENTKIFADVNGDEILWEPGAFTSGRFKVENNGSLALKYKLNILTANATKTPSGKTLLDVLSVYALTRNKSTGSDAIMQDKSLNDLQIDSAVPNYDPTVMPLLKNGLELEAFLLPNESITYEIGVCWVPTELDNEFNVDGGLSIDFMVSLIATQKDFETDGDGFYYDVNSEYPQTPTIQDKWDGTADTSWYDPANPQTEYKLGTAEQIVGLSELISGNTTFSGVTITLIADVDLYCEDTTPSADGDPLTFRPIGDHSKGGTFEGVFDGNGKTISNIYQNGWDLGYQWGVYGSYGLFGNINNATIKNLTLTGGESYIEGGDVSFVAGSATGTCVFENITIENSSIATYNNGCGGIIGWSGEGEYTFKNITLKEDVVLGGLWGSFDSSIGGIVGQAEPGATYNFENVNIACRIDAYNDCTASYDYYNYRMCGMIVGRCEETINVNGSNYPDLSKYNFSFNNVTVTYGNWANYHYCRADGARAKRVEAGYQYGGIGEDYDHTTCTAHCKELIAFDQLFGGDQYDVKGLKDYDGTYGDITVIYNNK